MMMMKAIIERTNKKQNMFSVKAAYYYNKLID